MTGERTLAGSGPDAEEGSLEERYQRRLEDIADLGRIVARQDAKIQHLEKLHGDDVKRHHILLRLADSRIELQAALKQSTWRQQHRRARNRVAEEISMIEASGLFDAEWYCAMYADVADCGIDPARHFVMRGAYELRNPGPEFDSFEYHKAYADVTGEGMTALMHYVRNGKGENRQKFPVG